MKLQASRALSLIQPWASLWASGIKRWETRGWSTNHRGPVIIHASATRDEAGRELWAKLQRELVPATRAQSELLRLDYAELPRKALIGQVQLTGVRPSEAVQPTNVERLLGNYATHRFIWIGADPLLFFHPVPCPGSLGLWRIKSPLEAEVCCTRILL